MDKQLDFLLEIDKLKNIIRRSPLVDESRRENSAEHSWHLALYALILSDKANTEVNIDRVIRMLLIHDIVEIDAGDYPIYDAYDKSVQQEAELKGAKRLFGLLPEAQGKELMDLWLEFEEGTSDDAAFANALDRMQPLMHNVATGGKTWIESGVDKERIVALNEPVISKGSLALWRKAKAFLDKHFSS